LAPFVYQLSKKKDNSWVILYIIKKINLPYRTNETTTAEASQKFLYKGGVAGLEG